jgi:pyrroline-5-carboxylate reductase
MTTSSVLLVGCGKMGGAMLEGWLKDPANSDTHFTVIEPDIRSEEALLDRFVTSQFTVVGSVDDVPGDHAPDAVVFAVKPQVIPGVMQDYVNLPESVPFISIIAGKTIGFFAQRAGERRPIVRAMPNLPASIGKGTVGAYANDYVDATTRALATRLLGATALHREIYWVEHEEWLDAVTAISGSGPAYVFHFLEALMRSARELGLPDPLAKGLAYDTVLGSALLASESLAGVSELREQVTSKGGTTAAALEILMEKHEGLTQLMTHATRAAWLRSKELAE